MAEAQNNAVAPIRMEGTKQRFYPPNYFPPPYDPLKDKHFNIDDRNFWLGESRSGKTTACTQWLLLLRRLYPIVFCFSKTARNNYWHQYLPDTKIAHDVDEDVCEELLRDNYKRFEKWKILKVKTGKYVGNPIVKVIFEDCITENQLRNSVAVKTIALNGRHFGISCDVLAQDFIGMTPGERDNFDRWILFRPDGARSRNMIRESFGDEIMNIAERVWADNKALVINKKKRVPLMERLYTWDSDIDLIKAMTHKNLTLGNAKSWSGIRIEKQKKEHPYVELPSLPTLAGKFNVEIKDTEEPLDGVNMAEKGNDVGEDPEEKGKAVTEPDGTWWEIFKGGDTVVVF